jgi:hypothetical protein
MTLYGGLTGTSATFTSLNVGNGTTVSASININSDSSTASYLYFNGASVNNYHTYIIGNSGASSNLKFYAANTLALTIASTAAANFSGRINVNGASDDSDAGMQVNAPSGAGKFIMLGRNSSSALVYSLTSAGAATFSSTITSQANGSTFGTASATGRAIILQAGSSNQAIMFKNAAGGDGTLFLDGTSTSLDYVFNTYSVGNAFVIKNNGQIGFGTSSIDSTISVDIQNASATSNNVFLRIKNNAGSEDVGLKIAGTYGTAYEHTIGVNTVITSADLIFSNSNSVGYRWYIDSIEKLRMTAAGKIIINCSAVDDSLVVNNSSSSNPYGMQMGFTAASPNNTSNYFFNAYDTTNTKAAIYSNGTFGSRTNTYTSISDIRLKENITLANPKLDDLLKVNIVNYNFIDDDKKEKQLGVISQELELIFPNMVFEAEDKVTGEIYKHVKYSIFVPMIIKAIQEQQAQIEELRAMIAAK